MPVIGSLPEDLDAVFYNPAPLLAADTERLSQAPISFSAPTGASYPITPSVLVTVASGLVKVGKPSAQLAHQIFQGVKPADLPVETPDFLVTLNLKTAQAIGLTVPDDLMGQADMITHQTPAIATDPEGDCRFQGLGCVERHI
jgi:ABC-type uncharacterized transport system substrate-binding protein